MSETRRTWAPWYCSASYTAWQGYHHNSLLRCTG
jgi:hypothetical protein